MKDKEVLGRIKEGDERALDFLYKKYYRMMVNMVIRNNGSEEEAKDIYQEALIVFWQKAASGKLVMTSKISTYLYSICQNLWRKELERKSRLVKSEGNEGDPEYMTHEQDERIRIIHECINSMGTTCKKLLSYHYFDRLSMNEIATRLGYANTDTAKTKKYKCKQKLYNLVKSKYSASDFMD